MALSFIENCDLGKVASALGAKKVNIIGFMAPVADGRDAIRLVVDKTGGGQGSLCGRRLGNL